MSFILLLLGLDVIELLLSSWNFEESLVFIRLNVSFLISFRKFALRLLFELVCKRNEKVLSPDLELSVERRSVFDGGEETIVIIRQ
jgi:hypothetical protein